MGCHMLLDVAKGYLYYKMKSSQNVLSEAQVKNFLISLWSYCSFLKIFKFLYLKPSHDLPSCDVMMSISTWEKCDVMTSISTWGKFDYLLNVTSLSQQTWSTDTCKHGQYFTNLLNNLENWG